MTRAEKIDAILWGTMAFPKNAPLSFCKAFNTQFIGSIDSLIEGLPKDQFSFEDVKTFQAKLQDGVRQMMYAMKAFETMMKTTSKENALILFDQYCQNENCISFLPIIQQHTKINDVVEKF